MPRLISITFFLILAVAVRAQLCDGSLGDPAVNITFGTGSGNTGYAPTNAYTYTSSQCPGDGYYTITRSSPQCFGTWHVINSDHTGGGAFMLVNASYEPGDFFVTTVTDLCPNTNYQFAAWVMNVLGTYGIRPNLTFSVEAENGTLLGQYSTGDIPETSQPQWKQYGLYFQTPANNAVIVLRITNNAPGGNGNDLALDDITFRPCGPAITAVIQNNKDTVDICPENNSTFTFDATVSAGFLLPVYQWQISTDNGTIWTDITGANSLSYTRKPTSPGAYLYRLTVTEETSASIISCRVSSNVVAINARSNPEVSAGPDRISIASAPVILQGSVTGDLPVYRWNPSSYLDNDSLLTPVAKPPSDITYTLSATTQYGCKNSDAMQVKTVAGIFIPTAFTPNNDGKNDTWQIPYLDALLGASVTVYNRFGQIVYHVEGKTVNWNGTFNNYPQPSGVYTYYIKFKSGFADMRGTFVLIR